VTITIGIRHIQFVFYAWTPDKRGISEIPVLARDHISLLELGANRLRISCRGHNTPADPSSDEGATSTAENKH